MASKVESFKCEYCTRTFSTIDCAVNHENKCKNNPSRPENILKEKQNAAKRAAQEEVDQIRDSATSPEHLMQLLIAFFYSKGVKFSLRSYPSSFSLTIGNSHNSPQGYPRGDRNSIANGVPSSYPGWSGKWEGSIEVIDPSILGIKDPRPSLFDFRNGKFGFQIPWLQTGSGNFGANFSMGGILWLYDFPKMLEEYETANGPEKLAIHNYEQSLMDYHKEFKKRRQEFIDKDSTSRDLEHLTKQLNDLQLKVLDAKKNNTKYLTNKYNEQNGFEIPLPLSAFSLSNEVMEIHSDVSHKTMEKPEEYKGILERIIRAEMEMSSIVKNNPERFI